MMWDLKNVPLVAACVALLLTLGAPSAHAEAKKRKNNAETAATEKRKSKSAKPRQAKLPASAEVIRADNQGSQAEARLIDIYKLIGQARTREALPLAERLVREHLNFQLAQLVYGDLLTARLRPVRVPQTMKADNERFEAAFEAWQSAKSGGDLTRLMAWYTPDFKSNGMTLAQWTPNLQAELKKIGGRGLELKDVSYLRRTDASDTMVVTFAKQVLGAQTGQTKRQYWIRHGAQWKIFFEGKI